MFEELSGLSPWKWTRMMERTRPMVAYLYYHFSLLCLYTWCLLALLCLCFVRFLSDPLFGVKPVVQKSKGQLRGSKVKGSEQRDVLANSTHPGSFCWPLTASVSSWKRKWCKYFCIIFNQFPVFIWNYIIVVKHLWCCILLSKKQQQYIYSFVLFCFAFNHIPFICLLHLKKSRFTPCQAFNTQPYWLYSARQNTRTQFFCSTWIMWCGCWCVCLKHSVSASVF